MLVRTPIAAPAVARAFGLLVALGGECHASPTLLDFPLVVIPILFLLLPLTLVETVVCDGVMAGAVPFGRLFLTVMVANAVSTPMVFSILEPVGQRAADLVHVIYSSHALRRTILTWLPPRLAVGLSSLFVVVFLTVVVESFVVSWMCPGVKASTARLAVFCANLLTYAGVLTFFWFPR